MDRRTLWFCLISWSCLFLSQTADAHDWYTPLANPSGQACCGATDCMPREARVHDGIFQMKVNGVWYSVPKSNILPIESPDGQTHGCFWGGEIRCVIMGQGN